MTPVWLKQVKFDSKGLVPAVIQDAASGEVLMVAYMNEEALLKTLKTGKTHFHSRSRKKIWLKGETSGHWQKVKEIRLDCDGDTVLVRAAQVGGACHEGYASCFFRRMEGDRRWRVADRRIFDPKRIYGK